MRRPSSPTIDTSVATPACVKPSALIWNPLSSELRGIRLKRVEAVAAVATQAVISARPHTTWPVTKLPVPCDVRMKMPQTSVTSAKQ